MREWIKQRKRNDLFDILNYVLVGYLIDCAGAFKKSQKSIRAPKDSEKAKVIKPSKKDKKEQSDAVNEEDDDKPPKKRNKASIMDF